VSFGLLNGDFAPVSYSIGFIHRRLEDVAEAALKWQDSILAKQATRTVKGTIRDLLKECEPLTFPETKRLFVETSSAEWTALFLNTADVPSPSSTTAYLCRAMQVDGVCATWVPSTFDENGTQLLHGVTRFEKFAAYDTGYLNYERVIEVAFEDGRWTFELSGAPQPFEQVDAYRARKSADRFTPQMLLEYCAACGIYPFDETYYSPLGVLMESKDTEIYRSGGYQDVQRELRIEKA
jgi:hypothetical protein